MRDRDFDMAPETKTIPQYEPPQVVDFGDLVELTQGSSSGCYTDVDFPARTPVGQLTFSC